MIHFINLTSDEVPPEAVKRVSQHAARLFAEHGFEVMFNEQHGLGIELPDRLSTARANRFIGYIVRRAINDD